MGEIVSAGSGSGVTDQRHVRAGRGPAAGRPLGLTEVLAEVDEGNSASAAVLGRLGMTPFAVLPGLLGPMTRYRKTR
jgi:hypothetical protein